MWTSFANTCFCLCVDLLEWLGQLTGLGYIGINVAIFCILLPIILVALIWRWLFLELRLRKGN
jgi:hypothetical protein